MLYNKKEKNNYKLLLEELELDLIEVQAYRSLRYKNDDFGFKYYEKEDNFYIGSEDIFNEMDEQSLKDTIDRLKYDNSNNYLNKKK